MIETVRVGTPATGLPTKHEEPEKEIKIPVRLIRDTKINFKTEIRARGRERPARNREELRIRWGMKRKKQVTTQLKEWGFTFNDYTWGLENANRNREYALYLWKTEGLGAHIVRKALEDLNVFLKYSAMTQAMRKMDNVDAKIKDDIRPGTGKVPGVHDRDVPSTAMGGSARRTGKKGVLEPAHMNINIRRVCVGLHCSEAEAKALYEAELRRGCRGEWLVTRHKELYGDNKSFRETAIEFFPVIAAKLGFMEIK